MANVEVYTKSWCGYSVAAKALLDAKGVPYTDIDVTADPYTERAMIERSGDLHGSPDLHRWPRRWRIRRSFRPGRKR